MFYLKFQSSFKTSYFLNTFAFDINCSHPGILLLLVVMWVGAWQGRWKAWVDWGIEHTNKMPLRSVFKNKRSDICDVSADPSPCAETHTYPHWQEDTGTPRKPSLFLLRVVADGLTCSQTSVFCESKHRITCFYKSSPSFY